MMYWKMVVLLDGWTHRLSVHPSNDPLTWMGGCLVSWFVSLMGRQMDGWINAS